MAITSGTHYFGPGETLTNWTDVVREINGQTFTGDVTFIQTGNILQTSALEVKNINALGRMLKFTSNYNHEGSFNKGWHTSTSGIITTMITFDSSCSFGHSSTLSADGYVLIDGLKTYIHTIYHFSTNIGGRFILKNHLTSGGGTLLAFSNSILECMNIKCYSLNDTLNIWNSGFGGSIYSKFENITFLTRGSGMIYLSNPTPQNLSAVAIKNVYAYNIWDGTSTLNLYGFSGTNCATRDASVSAWPNSFTGITSAHFISLDPTSDDFMNIDTSSFLFSAGAIPSLSANTVGIRGNLRPGDGYYSIGADEYGNNITRFVINKFSGTIPFYFRLTDTSDFTGYTSAIDYRRIWRLTNQRTSHTEYFETTSASIEYCISADSLLNDTYTLSLSAVI